MGVRVSSDDQWLYAALSGSAKSGPAWGVGGIPIVADRAGEQAVRLRAECAEICLGARERSTRDRG